MIPSLGLVFLAASCFGLPDGGVKNILTKTTFEVSCMATYDSNLLKFSSRDRERYLDDIEFHKSPVQTLDDLRTDYTATAEFRPECFRKLTTSFRGTINLARHLNDPIKNFNWISLTGRQDISRRVTATVNFFYEPEYYIRDYLDIHTNAVHHCRFSLYQWRGDLTWRPRWLFDATVSLKSKQYRYNTYFTEYDGNAIEPKLRLVYRPRGWRIAVDYGYNVFDNSGFRSSDLLPSDSFLDDSEFGQGDYRENSYSISVKREFRALGRDCSLMGLGEFTDRYYTTDRNLFIDPMHSERNDRTLGIEFSGTISLTKTLELEMGGGNYRRDSNAPLDLVAKLKSYQRWTMWMGVNYLFKRRG